MVESLTRCGERRAELCAPWEVRQILDRDESVIWNGKPNFWPFVFGSVVFSLFGVVFKGFVLTGFFMTEEALRRALGETAPREMIEFVVAQSEKTRAEFLDRVSREFGKALAAMDPVELAKRLLEGRTVEISATIRFVEDEKKKPAEKG